MKNKKLILVLVIMLVIGFASISTTLVINGVIGVGANKDDFNVIFTEALLDGNSTNVTISENKKNISFTTKKLTTIGDSTILNYKVKNTSTQYDANVIINCTNNAEEYIKLTSSFDNKDIPLVEPVKMVAQEVKSGYINAELIKSYAGEDKEIKVSCSLVVNAESKEGYSYTVNFDSDGGSSIEDKIIDYQGSYGELPVPEKEGYVFLGWYDENEQKVESETEIKEKGNKTLHAKWEPVCLYEVGKTWTFGYTGGEQEFEVPCSGEYKLETWGASGGANNLANKYLNNYSFGGYTSGNVKIQKSNKLYIYVGAQGQSGTLSASNTANSFNGGGSGARSADNDDGGGAGGGATDIRLTNGNWDNFASLKSRIMVAGGGSGGATVDSNFTGRSGGAGGGITGTGNVWRWNNSQDVFNNFNASQTTGYSFGKGQNGRTINNYPHASAGGAGAGSGYYGGMSDSNTTYPGGAGGGSSFISGHDGCDAISESSTSTNIIHTGQPNHYSGYVFKDTIMIDGNGYNWTDVRGDYVGMPSHDGTSTITGNTGHGYAKITYLGYN